MTKWDFFLECIQKVISVTYDMNRMKGKGHMIISFCAEKKPLTKFNPLL